MKSGDGVRAMARVEHVALWTGDLERLRAFYLRYFDAVSNDGYYSPQREFRSYFLSFGSGARIELMQIPDLAVATPGTPRVGIAHIALSMGTRSAVDDLTSRLRHDGYVVVDGPRVTGDGYYESVILDPDGNRLELTA